MQRNLIASSAKYLSIINFPSYKKITLNIQDTISGTHFAAAPYL